MTAQPPWFLAHLCYPPPRHALSPTRCSAVKAMGHINTLEERLLHCPPLIALHAMLTEWKLHKRISGAQWASTPALEHTAGSCHIGTIFPDQLTNRQPLPGQDPAGVMTCKEGTGRAVKGARDCFLNLQRPHRA